MIDPQGIEGNGMLCFIAQAASDQGGLHALDSATADFRRTVLYCRRWDKERAWLLSSTAGLPVVICSFVFVLWPISLVTMSISRFTARVRTR